MIEQIVHHLVMHPEEFGTADNIHWTSDPHPLCARIREGSELILDYIYDYDAGVYKDGKCPEDEITDPDILALIHKVESLPYIYETNTGVSLHRDPNTGYYYLLSEVGLRDLWYEVGRHSEALDALLADLYADVYTKSSDIGKTHLQRKLQAAGLWELVSKRLNDAPPHN